MVGSCPVLDYCPLLFDLTGSFLHRDLLPAIGMPIFRLINELKGSSVDTLVGTVMSVISSIGVTWRGKGANAPQYLLNL
jgi:hypothetical protein